MPSKAYIMPATNFFFAQDEIDPMTIGTEVAGIMPSYSHNQPIPGLCI